MALAHCACGRNWTGAAQAHCPTCHEHFGSVAGFDRHRSTGHCQHPAGVTTAKTDRPWFRAVTGPYGVTWVRDNPAGHYWAKEDAS